MGSRSRSPLRVARLLQTDPGVFLGKSRPVSMRSGVAGEWREGEKCGGDEIGRRVATYLSYRLSWPCYPSLPSQCHPRSSSDVLVASLEMSVDERCTVFNRGRSLTASATRRRACHVSSASLGDALVGRVVEVRAVVQRCEGGARKRVRAG